VVVKGPISVKTGPKYQKVKNWIGIFKDQMFEMSLESMEEISKDFAEEVRKVIVNQLYKWKPLTQRYLERKRRKGLDTRILIATKSYLNSIEAKPRKKKGKITSWSVVPGHFNLKHKPSGLKMHTLARWLEFGNKRIPARPHWRPAWSAYVRKKNLYSKKILKKVIKKTKRKARL